MFEWKYDLSNILHGEADKPYNFLKEYRFNQIQCGQKQAGKILLRFKERWQSILQLIQLTGW